MKSSIQNLYLGKEYSNGFLGYTSEGNLAWGDTGCKLLLVTNHNIDQIRESINNERIWKRIACLYDFGCWMVEDSNSSLWIEGFIQSINDMSSNNDTSSIDLSLSNFIVFLKEQAPDVVLIPNHLFTYLIRNYRLFMSKKGVSVNRYDDNGLEVIVLEYLFRKTRVIPIPEKSLYNFDRDLLEKHINGPHTFLIRKGERFEKSCTKFFREKWLFFDEPTDALKTAMKECMKEFECKGKKYFPEKLWYGLLYLALKATHIAQCYSMDLEHYKIICEEIFKEKASNNVHELLKGKQQSTGTKKLTFFEKVIILKKEKESVEETEEGLTYKGKPLCRKVGEEIIKVAKFEDGGPYYQETEYYKVNNFDTVWYALNNYSGQGAIREKYIRVFAKMYDNLRTLEKQQA